MTSHEPPTGRLALAARVRAPVGWLLAGAIAMIALAVRDPHHPGTYPTCPFLALTGVPCPGCGGLRALHDLAAAEPWQALSSNAWVATAAPLAAWSTAAWLLRRWRGRGDERAPLTRPVTLAVAFGALLAFGLFRLTPLGAPLLP